VLTYYNSRGDGTSGTKRRDFKYLDGARVLPVEHDCCTLVIHFSDSAVHRLSVVEVKEGGGSVDRQVRMDSELFLQNQIQLKK